MQALNINFAKNFKYLLAALAMMLIGTTVVLAGSGPVDALQNTTDKLIAVLKQNKSSLEKHPNKIYPIIKRHLVPKVDFIEMSRWVVGRNAWKKSSKAERRRFVNAFQDLVIRTYAGALSDYSNQKIEYFPLRSGSKSKKRVQVKSQIHQSGKAPITVTYRLVKRKGQWKVYDMIIEGVSLIKGFQSQFSNDIKQAGLPGATDRILAHNGKN